VLVMEDSRHIESLLNLNSQLTTLEKAELRIDVIQHINHLLVYDFNKVIQILYRVDVNEQKLKELLQSNAQTDAAIIIADLLIERQEEKLKTKETFQSNTDIAEEDKW
jgi:hypothetical protein